MSFLVAYDIADPKRLRRVARLLERYALRCQKSVFLFDGDETGVAAPSHQVKDSALLLPSPPYSGALAGQR